MTAAEAVSALRSALNETGPAQPVRISRSLAIDLLQAFGDSAKPRKQSLTPRQHDVLAFIAASIQERNVAPTYKEIGQHFHLKSLASVAEMLSILERKGHIRRRHNEARSIELIDPAQ